MNSEGKLFLLVIAIMGMTFYSQYCDKPAQPKLSGDSTYSVPLIDADIESLEQDYGTIRKLEYHDSLTTEIKP